MPYNDADRTFIETSASTYRPEDPDAKQDVRDFFLGHPGTRADLVRRREYLHWLERYDGAESVSASCAALGYPRERATELRTIAASHWSNMYPGPGFIEPEAMEDHNTDAVGTQTHAARPSQPTDRSSRRSVLNIIDDFERNFRPGNELTLPPAGSVRSHGPDPAGGSSTSHRDSEDIFPDDEGDAPAKYSCQGDKWKDMRARPENPR